MKRNAFTLVELVVVILILGILAAVAFPRVLGVSGDARDANLLNSLATVRDAIDKYQAMNGELPGSAGTEAGFKQDLEPYLRSFPKNVFKNSDLVLVQTSGAPLSYVTGPTAWQYDNVTGEFIANTNSMSKDGVKRYWER